MPFISIQNLNGACLSFEDAILLSYLAHISHTCPKALKLNSPEICAHNTIQINPQTLVMDQRKSMKHSVLLRNKKIQRCMCKYK